MSRRKPDHDLARQWASRWTHLEIEALLAAEYRAARTPKQKTRYRRLVYTAMRALDILDEATVWYRYAARFGVNGPPMMAWHGDEDHLVRLMEEAIASDVPLTPERMWAAQGLDPPPPGADW